MNARTRLEERRLPQYLFSPMREKEEEKGSINEATFCFDVEKKCFNYIDSDVKLSRITRYSRMQKSRPNLKGLS